MNFREVKGRQLEWLNTGIEHGFSNFLFVDRRYRSNNVLRRIFSLARKHEKESGQPFWITQSHWEDMVANIKSKVTQTTQFADLFST